MNTVERTERALALAEERGFRIRREWLGGAGGGLCQYGGQKWVFLDLAQSAQEQLEQLLEILRDDSAASATQKSPDRSSAA